MQNRLRKQNTDRITTPHKFWGTAFITKKFPRFSILRYGLLPNTPVNNAELYLAEFYNSASSALWTFA